MFTGQQLSLTRRALLIAMVGPILVLMGFASRVAGAAEVKLFSLPGMMTVFEELGPKFEAASGHKLVVAFEVNLPMMRRIDAGERFDAIITGISDFDNLISRGKLAADFRVGLGRVGIGVWICAGAPKPDISTVDAFKRMLLDAKSISYTKESGAGIYMASVMVRLGIADEMRPKTRLLGGGGQNPRAVAAGDVQYGISIVTDGLGMPGVELLLPLAGRDLAMVDIFWRCCCRCQ